MIRRIEITFALPVELTDDEQALLGRLAATICRRHCPSGWAFWPSSFGDRVLWSKADAKFLGKTTDAHAPETGEPTFDDTVFSIGCAARELIPGEIQRRSPSGAHQELPQGGNDED
jgi:hypothetical protein